MEYPIGISNCSRVRIIGIQYWGLRIATLKFHWYWGFPNFFFGFTPSQGLENLICHEHQWYWRFHGISITWCIDIFHWGTCGTSLAVYHFDFLHAMEAFQESFPYAIIGEHLVNHRQRSQFSWISSMHTTVCQRISGRLSCGNGEPLASGNLESGSNHCKPARLTNGAILSLLRKGSPWKAMTSCLSACGRSLPAAVIAVSVEIGCADDL